MKTALILGAGTAGTIVANRLVSRLGDGWRVVILDPGDRHVFQPNLVFIPFGASATGTVKPRAETIAAGIRWQEAAVSHIVPELRTVYLSAGSPIEYDLLVIASGMRLRPDLTPGLLGDCWRTNVFDFYTLAGAQALQERLEKFEEGRFVVNVFQAPIKSPVAPIEFLFLADDFFRRRNVRHRVELAYVGPEAIPGPIEITARLSTLMMEREIAFERQDFSTLDGKQQLLRDGSGRVSRYDLLATVPVHSGADFVERSGIGDGRGLVPTDPQTLAAKHFPGIFVVGDATDLPLPKLGSVAHRQAEAVVENLVRAAEGRPLEPVFDGRAVEFIETGDGKAMLLEFDDKAGGPDFPVRGVGPFTQLEETRRNHFGKLGLQWLYWNAILPGRHLPGTAEAPPAGRAHAADLHTGSP